MWAERSALGGSQHSRHRARRPVSLSVVSKQVPGAAVLHPRVATEPVGPRGGHGFLKAARRDPSQGIRQPECHREWTQACPSCVHRVAAEDR